MKRIIKRLLFGKPLIMSVYKDKYGNKYVGVIHKQETLLGKTISKKDADKDSFEDVTKYKIERSYSEEEMLKMLHKFGFDYTYNYRGKKTIYEWISEWFEEYKRLEQLNK